MNGNFQFRFGTKISFVVERGYFSPTPVMFFHVGKLREYNVPGSSCSFTYSASGELE